MSYDRAEAATASHSTVSRPLSFPAKLLRVCDRQIACFRREVSLAPTVAAAFMTMFASECAAADPSNSRVAGAARSNTQFAAFIIEAARRFAIPAPWIGAVLQAESAGDARALSSAGAMGLMQIMPDTWADLRERYGLGDDPYQPHDNILAGAAYLRELHDRYGSPGFLAAYNAGPERWEAHLALGQELPSETRLYVARLLPLITGDITASTSAAISPVAFWTEASLFPVQTLDRSDAVGSPAKPQSAGAPAAVQTALMRQSTGLFVTLSHQSPFR